MKTGATGKETRTPMRGIPDPAALRTGAAIPLRPRPAGRGRGLAGGRVSPKDTATAATQLDPAWPQTQPVLRPHRPGQGLCSGCSEARVWVKAQLRSVREGRGLRL